MLRLRTIGVLFAFSALLLLVSAHAWAGDLLGGPFQRAAPAQKGLLLGSAQKVVAPAPIQKMYGAAPSQKLPMPAAPVQKYGPAQKVAVSSCCCPHYSGISYHRHRLLRKRCCACHPPVQTVLAVQDPRYCCCGVEIPVCISACCTGAPQVQSHVGLLGCGYVTYRWCCGYTVKVVFRRRGDIVVHTYGL